MTYYIIKLSATIIDMLCNGGSTGFEREWSYELCQGFLDADNRTSKSEFPKT